MLEQSRQYRAMAEARAKLNASEFVELLNHYGPYQGAGIRVVEGTEDFRRFAVEMSLEPSNQNYVGTHFGGSLYSMCDPFYVLILIRNLGPEFLVWDKSASIRFKKPGMGTVRARFEVSEAEIDELRERLKTQRRLEKTFTTLVTDESGVVIAEVEKTLYVRRNPVQTVAKP